MQSPIKMPFHGSNGSKLTPPDSPRMKPRSVSLDTLTDDEETLNLIGTTRFIPRKDIKNILITGGAGFMLVDRPCRYETNADLLSTVAAGSLVTSWSNTQSTT